MRCGVLAAGLAMAATVAAADSIDGDWCSPTGGLHLRIEGAKVTTPTGSQTTGNYTRHAFSYVVPEGESGAGEAITLQLISEEQAYAEGFGEASGIWTRCQFNA